MRFGWGETMLGSMEAPEALGLWRRVLVEGIRSEKPDLTSRQLAIMLIVYLDPPPHTVRGLAAALDVSKPAVTRALDTLGAEGLLKRVRDEADRRNVFVQRTIQGSVFMDEFGEAIVAAAVDLKGDAEE